MGAPTELRTSGRLKRFLSDLNEGAMIIVRFANDDHRMKTWRTPGGDFGLDQAPYTAHRLVSANNWGGRGNRGLRVNSPEARRARLRLNAAAASQLSASPQFLQRARGNRGLRVNSPEARGARLRLNAAAASQLSASPQFLQRAGNRGLRVNSPEARGARLRLNAAAASQLSASPQFLQRARQPWAPRQLAGGSWRSPTAKCCRCFAAERLAAIGLFSSETIGVDFENFTCPGRCRGGVAGGKELLR